MRKKYFALMMAGILCSSVFMSGCGKADEPQTEIEEDDEPEIDDGDTPYAGYEEEPDEEVAEEPTPFSPYTGDDRHTAVWSIISLLSLAGIAVVARKRKEE